MISGACNNGIERKESNIFLIKVLNAVIIYREFSFTYKDDWVTEMNEKVMS